MALLVAHSPYSIFVIEKPESRGAHRTRARFNMFFFYMNVYISI